MPKMTDGKLNFFSEVFEAMKKFGIILKAFPY